MSNEPAWPALGSERHEWHPVATSGLYADRNVSSQTYCSAVPSQIAGLIPYPSPEAAEAADEASRELSRLDTELGDRVATFGPVLLRSESASSSQVENLTASARSILSAELGAKRSSNAQLIVANFHAMEAAIELSADIGAASILKMHEVLMANQPRHTPGRWRQEAVWIGQSATSPVGATYVAPHYSRIGPLIDDLVRFAQRTTVPALVSVAITHAQFETIHPFTDGNGRTGRAFAQAQLRQRQVTRNVAVPVSAGLLADLDGYHQALTDYRAGDVSPIIINMALAALRAIENTRRLVLDIDEIADEWHERLRVRKSSNAWRLLDVIVRRPVIDSATAARELGVQQPNIYPPMRVLEEAGILTSKKEHGLGPFWRSDEILSVLDAFAERAGRREAWG